MLATLMSNQCMSTWVTAILENKANGESKQVILFPMYTSCLHENAQSVTAACPWSELRHDVPNFRCLAGTPKFSDFVNTNYRSASMFVHVERQSYRRLFHGFISACLDCECDSELPLAPALLPLLSTFVGLLKFGIGSTGVIWV